MPLTMLRKQRDGVQPDGFHYRDRTASGPGLFVFFLSIGAGVAVSAAIDRPWPVLAGILIGLYSLFAIRIAQQWEKIAVLRLGRYRGLRGPGLFLIVPIIDTLSRYVDQRILDEKTNPWGITVQSVEIRDVQIPSTLEDAMSRQAQAERERQARIILGTAETEISEKFSQAALVYQNNPIALHLRAMNMLYEAIKEKGAMVIVPSSAVETMGLGGLMGTAALSKQ